MRREAGFLALFFAFAILAAACSDEESSPPEQEVCTRMQQCQSPFLQTSVQDCERLVGECVAGQSPSVQEKFENNAWFCLESSDCAGFNRCYEKTAVCNLADLGTGGGGGSGGASGTGGTGGGAGGESGSGGTGEGCTDDETRCVDAENIDVCVEGAWQKHGCDDMCVRAFGPSAQSVGCELDEDTGMDDCRCSQQAS